MNHPTYNQQETSQVTTLCEANPYCQYCEILFISQCTAWKYFSGYWL